jgi:Ca2+-binding RTX toxin-like protein
LIGDAGNDTLTGLSNNDRLIGLGGSDKIVGGDGNDILIGGIGTSRDTNSLNLSNAGFDTLIGGRGRDRFALEQGTGAVYIRDFHDREDHLSLVRGISFRNLRFQKEGSYIGIVFRNDLLAVLTGIRLDQLTAADFVKL